MIPPVPRVARILLVSCAVLAALAAASPSRARYAEYLPASSSLGRDVDLLRAEGFLVDLPAGTRPWARTDVAEALAHTLAAHPEAAHDPLLRRVARDLARELSELD